MNRQACNGALNGTSGMFALRRRKMEWRRWRGERARWGEGGGKLKWTSGCGMDTCRSKEDNIS